MSQDHPAGPGPGAPLCCPGRGTTRASTEASLLPTGNVAYRTVAMSDADVMPFDAPPGGRKKSQRVSPAGVETQIDSVGSFVPRRAGIMGAKTFNQPGGGNKNALGNDVDVDVLDPFVEIELWCEHHFARLSPPSSFLSSLSLRVRVHVLPPTLPDVRGPPCADASRRLLRGAAARWTIPNRCNGRKRF